MSEQVQKIVRELLDSGKIAGFVGLCYKNGHIGPHFFRPGDNLDKLATGDFQKAGDARYPLNKLLVHLARAYPDDRFGVLVRGCDERGLKTLYTWNQLNPENVVAVGITCPQDLADTCECEKPFPDEAVEEAQAAGASRHSVQQVDGLDLADRFDHWMREFYKCIKCYGCRDICPMCFCKECSLEDKELVAKDELPPEIPIFHLTRAMHMAGRCIDCGLCSEACPADIPLRTLYKKVAAAMETEFNYKTGYQAFEKSPLNLMG